MWKDHDRIRGYLGIFHQELRLSDEIGKYVLENPLRRMTKAGTRDGRGR